MNGDNDRMLENRVATFRRALEKMRTDPRESTRIKALTIEVDGDVEVYHDDGRPERAISSSEERGVMHPSIDDPAVAHARMVFTEFFTQEYYQLVRFLMRNAAEINDALDVAREAFREVWRQMNRPGSQDQFDEPRAWVRQVALTKYRQLRMAPASVTRQTDEDLDAVLLDTGRPELTIRGLDVLAALHNLDADAQAVLAFHLDGFPSSTITTYLDLTDKETRDLLAEARRILKHTLAPHFDAAAGRTQGSEALTDDELDAMLDKVLVTAL